VKTYLLPLLLIPIGYAQTSSKCADLTKFKIPGVGMTIQKAQTVPAATRGKGAAMPAYCQIEGIIDQRTGSDGKTYGIGFGISLPENWNNRFLFQGGGGYNGSVRPPLGGAAAGSAPGFSRGFAVVSTDSGHKGETFDTTFNVDQEASLDFAYIAVGRVAELSKQIVAHYYGQPSRYSYFAGCSTGGREAMLMTQRYPDFFDGVISGDPAMRTGYSGIGHATAAVAFNQIAPKKADGKPDASKVFSDSDKKLIVNGILNQCDAKDGLKDGMIFNTSCKFDPSVLVCKGAKNDACLTSQQANALAKAFAAPKDFRGNPVYAPLAFDTGIAGLLPSATPGRGANSTALEFDVDERLAALRSDPLEALTDTTWTNLNKFSRHGGKLLFYHGMSDQAFSALDTLDYYQKMSKANGGAEQVQNWSRIYLVPGMAHCRGGEAALDNFDLLTAVVDWVEKGTAPESVVATGTAFPGRSRPLCAFPKYAHYKGQGDPEDAKSFECRE
jgi:hypothetical protein